jgi:hypothetical protein
MRVTRTRRRGLSSMVLLCLSALAGWRGWPAQESLVPPAPRVVPLPKAGFESMLAASWVAVGAGAGAWAQDPAGAHGGRAAAPVRGTPGKSALCLHQARLVAARGGESYKLAAWIKTAEATGETYLSLEGWRGQRFVARIARSQPLRTTTPGWVYCWVVGTVPKRLGISHLRPCLHSDYNAGTAWLDDVKLMRLPPDRPVVSGPPPPPPHGQLTVAGRHLVGRGGRRVRPWGVNCVDSPNRTYRELTYIPYRIREKGFNAVRLHLYDARITNTEATSARGELTTLLLRKAVPGDGSPLDKRDYFIYCCERAGLYLYLAFDRFGARFAPGDYHVLPSGGAEDEQAWKQALRELQPHGVDEHAYSVDPRLGAAQARFVQGWLNHRNPYTGRRLADDPYVALYELTNENHFPEWMLSGGFRSWTLYFQRVLQRRRNEWLRERYGSERALRAAWGELGPGEGLQAGTVQVAPTLPEANAYPAARLADFHRFVYDLMCWLLATLRGPDSARWGLLCAHAC